MVEVQLFHLNSLESSKLDGVDVMCNNNEIYLFFYKNSTMVKAIITSGFTYDLAGLDYLQYPHREAPQSIRM